MHKRIPWHLQLSLSTQGQFFFHHHVCGVSCCLGSPVALSASLLVYWNVCSCPEQLKEKTHVCPWKGKKKKKPDLVKGIVFWLRGHAGQKSHVKKDAWDDDKVLTCLYSRIHFVLNCATFCVTNLLLSRVCKDQKMLIFSQNLRKDHYRTMTWWWVEVIKCFHWDVRLSDGLTSSVCVSGFVWAFFLTQSKHRSSEDPRLHLCACMFSAADMATFPGCVLASIRGNSDFVLLKIRFRSAETAADARKCQIGPCLSLSWV